MLWTLFIFIVTLSVIVFIHEFGHFIVARWCGVKVITFSIGFGKKLISRSIRGTQFSLSLIPLGGYVKMVDSRVESLTAEQQQYAFDHQSISKRMAIVAAGPLANFLLAIVLYSIVNVSGFTALAPRVSSVVAGSQSDQVHFPENVLITQINSDSVKTWSDVFSSMIAHVGSHHPLRITVETPEGLSQEISMNLLLDIDALPQRSLYEQLGWVPEKINYLPIIDNMIPGSAAEKVGLQTGDRLLSYALEPDQEPIVFPEIFTIEEWQNFIDVVHNTSILYLMIEREEQPLKFTIPLPSLEQTHTGDYYSLGLMVKNNTIHIKYGIVSAFFHAIERTYTLIKQTIISFYQLLTGHIGLDKLSGPVSIANATSTASHYGLMTFLSFCAFISVSLGVVNLLPIPMLDGGQLLFLSIEKIRGKPVSAKLQERFFLWGLIILIILMGIALFNDFNRM